MTYDSLRIGKRLTFWYKTERMYAKKVEGILIRSEANSEAQYPFCQWSDIDWR